MRSAVLLGIAGSLLLGTGVAAAAELEAHGPAECPDGVELGFRVERNVKVPLAQAPPVHFVVQMENGSPGYVARISATGAAGKETKERVLSGADCSQLADAVVVAITLALGASAPVTEQPGSGEPTRSQSSPDPPAPTSMGPASTEPARTEPSGADTGGAPATNEAKSSALRPSLSVSVLADAGSLPAPGLGMALGAQLGWGRLELRALGTMLFEQHKELPGVPPPGADLQLFAGSLLACTSVIGAPGSVFTLPVCLGLELGRLRGVGTGVADPRSGGALWAAPRVDLEARWRPPQTDLSIGLGLAGATPLERSRFALNEIGTVYRPPSVVGRLSLSLGLSF